MRNQVFLQANIDFHIAAIADHHGPPKVNFWQDPMSPSKWKEEHVSYVTFLKMLNLLTLQSLQVDYWFMSGIFLKLT